MNIDIIVENFIDDISDIDFVSESLIDNVKLMTQFSNFVSNAMITATKEYNKLVPQYNKMTNDIIGKHKESLINFTGSVEHQGYVYTFKDNTPNLKVQKQMNDMYISLIDKSTTMTQSELNDIKANRTSPYAKEQILASIINKKAPMTKESFKDECFKVYRNNKSTPHNIVYNGNEIREIIKKRHDMNKLISSLNRDADRITSALKEVNSLILTHSIGNSIELKSNLVQTTNIVVGKRRNNLTMDQKIIAYNIDSLYLNLSKVVLSHLVIAHSYKARAIIEMLKQDLTVLVKVLESEKEE